MVNGLCTRVEVSNKTGIPLSTLYRYHKKYSLGQKIFTHEIVFNEEEIKQIKKIRRGLGRNYDNN